MTIKKLLATRYSLHSDRGFTMIELLVAVGVIATVSSLVFANVSTSKKNLSRSVQKLALDIRQAQNLSLAPSDLPVCVYGIKLTSATTYDLYVNDIDCPAHEYVTYDSSTPTIIKSGTLESDVTITNEAGQDISFEAPEPITYLNGATGTAPMLITLQSPMGTKNIFINRFGRVEID